MADPVSTSTLGWMVNGIVSEVARAGDVAYVGGSFRTLSPSANLLFHTASFSTTSAVPVLPRLDLNGRLRAVVGAPGGGWIMAGEFTQVNGVTRQRLALLAVDGTLAAALNVPVNGTVRALAVSGATLYLGGGFSMVGGQPRAGLAAIDLSTGNVLPGFAPGVQGGEVYTLLVDGATLYIGGDFAMVAGVLRPAIAAVNDNTGALVNAFDAAADGCVVQILKSGSHLLVAGDFHTMGALSRRGVAKIDGATGQGVDAFNAQMTTDVKALAGNAATIFVGGDFTSAGGASRSRIAALDFATGGATAWNPGANGTIESLALSGTTLIAGGAFETIGGTERLYLAALDTTLASNFVQSWNPSMNDGVDFMAVDGAGTVFVGGDFTGFGAVRRDNLAAIDLQSAELLPWNPGTNGWVRALDIHGNTVFVGGDFTTIAGVSRGRIAGLNGVTGEAAVWNPHVNAPVKGMIVAGPTVYFVGEFTTLGQSGSTVARGRGAAVDVDGAVRPWNPAADDVIETVFVDGSAVYLAGQFQMLGGQPRVRLGAINATTAAVFIGFTPTINDTIYRIDVQDGRVYLGGAFQMVNGSSRNHAAAVQGVAAGTAGLPGTLLNWRPDVSGPIYDLDVVGLDVYLAGGFGSVDGESRPGIALVASDPTNGALRAWEPSDVSGGNISVIDTSNEAVLFGGALYDNNNISIGAVLYPIPAPAAPRPPATADVKVTSGAVSFVWARPPLGSEPTSYVIEAGSGPGSSDLGSVSTGSPGTAFAANGIPPGTYYFRMRSVNPHGTSVAGLEQAFSIGGAGCTAPPERPLDVTPTVNGSNVTIQWRSSPQSVVTEYVVRAGSGSGLSNLATLSVGSVTSLSVAAPPGAFFITVVAVNPCGVSAPSAEAVVVVGGAVVPPIAPFALTGGVVGQTVTLSWAAPAIGTGPFSYMIDVGAAPGRTDLQVPSAASSVVATGVGPGVYYVRVRAVGAAGLGPASNEVVLIVQ